MWLCRGPFGVAWREMALRQRIEAVPTSELHVNQEGCSRGHLGDRLRLRLDRQYLAVCREVGYRARLSDEYFGTGHGQTGRDDVIECDPFGDLTLARDPEHAIVIDRR